MKDFNWYTPDDFKEWSEHGKMFQHAISKTVNDQLEKKLKDAGFVKMYCVMDEDATVPHLITPNQTGRDTHEILYRTEKIEQTDDECELDHKTLLWLFKEEYGENPIDPARCQKCGKDLM